MAIFGISKTQLDAAIKVETDRAIAAEKAEANARIAADLRCSSDITAEATTRAANDQTNDVAHVNAELNLGLRINTLESRVKALEGGTPPPPPPLLVAKIAVASILEVDATHMLVTLDNTGTVAPASAVGTVTIDNPNGTAPGGGAFKWLMTRLASPYTTTFTYEITSGVVSASATCDAMIKPNIVVTPPPPPAAFTLALTPPDFAISGSQGLKITGDHFSDWGHPNEAVTVLVHADEAAHVTAEFDYILAAEAANQSSRDLVVGNATIPVNFLQSGATWATAFHAFVTAPFVLSAGDTLLRVAIPATSADWSNWLDLYKLTLTSDKKVTIAVIAPPPPPPPPPPVTTVALIKHGQDVPTPAQVAANFAYAETLPFDGMTMTLPGVSDRVFSSAVLTPSQVQLALTPLAGRTFVTLQRRFAMMYADAPSGANSLAPSNGWVATRANWGTLAQGCLANGLRGIVFDNEQYATAVFSGAKDWANAYARGKECMTAAINAYPTIEVLVFYGSWVSDANSAAAFNAAGVAANDVSFANWNMGPFFAGMVAATFGTQATVHDGSEVAYTARTAAQFDAIKQYVKTGTAASATTCVPAVDKTQYSTAVRAAFGLYNQPYQGQSMDATIWENVIRLALARSDEYVWLYTEPGTQNWWTPGGVSSAWIDATRRGKTPPVVSSIVVKPDLSPLSEPTPLPGGKTLVVPRDGAFIDDVIRNGTAPGDVVIIDGIIDQPGKACVVGSRDNAGKPIVIHGRPGSLVRCHQSGFEFFGGCWDWWLQCLDIQIDGGAYYGEGIYFDGTRSDFGGNGKGGGNVRVRKVRVRPVPGTNNIQRGAITLWGLQNFEISDCDLESAAWNNLGFDGGAASLISVGIGVDNGRVAPSWLLDQVGPITYRTAIQALPSINGIIRRVHGFHTPGAPLQGSVDRNGVEWDLYLGNSGGFYPNRIKNKMIIMEDIEFGDLDGRGINLGWGGADDVAFIMHRVKGVAPYARALMGSNPQCGIGGYAAGRGGWVECYDCDIDDSPGANNFEFDDFGGSNRPGGPIQGARNKIGLNGHALTPGGPALPAGFLS